MKRIFAITACALTLPGAALAATRPYTVDSFERVSVAAGVEADITLGSTRSVVADTKSDDFEALRIVVKDNALQIDRPPGSWFSSWFGNRPDYHVHIVTPTLRSLAASSGAEVTVKGSVTGDFSVDASSGSDVELELVKGGNVKVHTSSGGEASIAGTCVSLEAHTSSGSDLDAGDLKCDNVSLHTSSGSELSVSAAKSVTGEASSGSDIRVRGRPTTVQVETSSGANMVVRE